ncbi:LysM peptidoglycan-binding domain-containing protein [Rubrivirga sp.]|uniref:lytic transglycosylase domain-containing protein n=1 Tax=Rubrivirga sp. TaxID=1885344 RepID=UPI003B524EA9
MPRSLLAAALLVATPVLGAHAQTARTDTAPARPAQALEAPADARLPVSALADSPSDAELARRLAQFYARQADLLQADADGDQARYTVQLDDLVADVQAAALRPGALTDPRFRELFGSVMTEYERYYDRTLVDRGDVYAIRAAGTRAIERGFDEGAPLLEHVTLPDIGTFATTVPMDVNPKVERYLQFLLNRPSHVQRLRSRADTYFPMVERVLAEEGVPDEMKYLAMVESALNPVARSHMAAAGMWQFISATGRAYGLRAEREIDDRLDPEASTRAAARHLRDLYDRFGDWHLALAGYNCNPAVIARGVRRFEERTGQRATFWDIDHVIPSETRAYVPMFIATALILSNPDAYGFPAHEPGPAYVFDRIPAEGGTRLRDVARMIGTDEAVLTALNPSLRQGRVPDVRVPHMLRLPAGSYAEHAEALDRLAPPEARDERFAAGTVHFGPRAVRPLAPQEHGEAVAMLAARRDLRRSLQPRPRVVRDAPVPAYAAAAPATVADAEARYAEDRRAEDARPEAAPRPAFVARTEPTPERSEPELVADLEIDTPEAAPPTTPAGYTPPAPAAPSSAPPVRTVSTASARPTTHVVQRGEYLTQIAREYGMSLQDIRALNPGLGDHLRVGQRVRVSGTPAAPVAAPTRPAAPARPTTHRVRSGEHLTGIAQRYGVTVRQLREWNDLDSDVIRVGQRLRVTARGSRG